MNSWVSGQNLYTLLINVFLWKPLINLLDTYVYVYDLKLTLMAS